MTIVPDLKTRLDHPMEHCFSCGRDKLSTPSERPYQMGELVMLGINHVLCQKCLRSMGDSINVSRLVATCVQLAIADERGGEINNHGLMFERALKEATMPNAAIENLFTFHPPTEVQRGKYERIREAAKALAYVIDAECEPGADRTTAIRKVREAVMTANASIATNNAGYR